MNVCIIGGGIVSLTLAKALVNEGIYVDFFSNQKFNQIDKSRTLGISKANVDFFNENILDIKKLLWNIDKIEIYSDNSRNEKILDFHNSNKNLFSIIKNYQLYKFLETSLRKKKLFQNKSNYKYISNKNYNLIVNCDNKNSLSRKYFQKKIEKNYHSYAHTTILEHEKVVKNNTAVQIFTKKGPLAFLPISNIKTSIVYSARGLKDVDLRYLIKKYNNKYSIKKINKISNFKLSSLNLRNYHHKNILAFGDLLHKLHPLAGQGFNMSIRDIQILLKLIKIKLSQGLELDSSICKDFEKKMKHKNYLFSTGIDFVYEFFNFESKLNNSILSSSVKFLGKNKHANRFFTKLANDGIVI